VKPGIKIGDSLFDGHVCVAGKAPGTTRPVIADEGEQSILMDMLGEGS
jgi:hypothetical protein